MEFHGLGVTEHEQGSKTVMLIADLAMITGNIGRKGVCFLSHGQPSGPKRISNKDINPLKLLGKFSLESLIIFAPF